MAESRGIIRSVFSVYRHAYAIRKADTGEVFFRLPERMPFEERDDNILHIVQRGERLWDIAVRYFQGRRFRACDMWEVLANFQPNPIIDPTVLLRAGQVIYVPSDDYIEEVVFGPSLADVPAI